MISEITIKIAFTQPGGERSESPVTSIDVAPPPALPANGGDQIPPVPGAEDGGLAAADVPPPPSLASHADVDIPPLPSADDGGDETGSVEGPPTTPKPRRNRAD